MTMLKCHICGEPATHLWRCDDHFHCEDCESTTDLMFDEGTVLCQSCKKARVEKRLAAREDDEFTNYMVNITCPYCGWTMSSSWEMSSDTGEYTCDDCENTFSYERVVDISYNTRKL